MKFLPKLPSCNEHKNKIEARSSSTQHWTSVEQRGARNRTRSVSRSFGRAGTGARSVSRRANRGALRGVSWSITWSVTGTFASERSRNRSRCIRMRSEYKQQHHSRRHHACHSLRLRLHHLFQLALNPNQGLDHLWSTESKAVDRSLLLRSTCYRRTHVESQRAVLQLQKLRARSRHQIGVGV